MKTALVLVARLQRKIWLRAALWTLGAVAFALAAGLAAPLLAFAPTLNLGQGSVGTILQIIATSMLTVTTFSLTTMVTAYSSASAVATPRATQLLVDDPTSQTALSTFIGAFVYSLVGIIALSTGYYGDEGRTLLFLGTIVVIAVIVITLLRWIAHLSTFGRMADVIDRVEDAACTVVTAYGRRPTWGAQRSSTAPGSQFRGVAIDARETGCVTLIDFAALQRIAERVDADLHVASMPGRTVNPATPLAFVGAEVDDE
ncbi:MAG: DUF2254 domain-containing protein, partial [Actinobacteria bacterium]|nr:DUF2254 domain-containing protein [Actinomycetota bacterium]